MKLTKLQRHTAYIIMKAELKDRGYGFFCGIIEDTFGIKMRSNGGSIRQFFPELWRKKPSNAFAGGTTMWFLGYDTASRIRLLNQCIEETL